MKKTICENVVQILQSHMSEHLYERDKGMYVPEISKCKPLT